MNGWILESDDLLLCESLILDPIIDRERQADKEGCSNPAPTIIEFQTNHARKKGNSRIKLRDWEEDAVQCLGLFAASYLPQITHGICPDCPAPFNVSLSL